MYTYIFLFSSQESVRVCTCWCIWLRLWLWFVSIFICSIIVVLSRFQDKITRGAILVHFMFTTFNQKVFINFLRYAMRTSYALVVFELSVASAKYYRTWRKSSRSMFVWGPQYSCENNCVLVDKSYPEFCILDNRLEIFGLISVKMKWIGSLRIFPTHVPRVPTAGPLGRGSKDRQVFSSKD